MSLSESQLSEIADVNIQYQNKPIQWVMYMFPWGEEGPLQAHKEPFKWQLEELEMLEDNLSFKTPFRRSIATGQGTGKTGYFGFTGLFLLSTFVNAQGVMTANTETQLRTKTYAEMMKWLNLGLCRHIFNDTGTAITSIDPKYKRTWRLDAIPWSEDNPDAFGGMHNKYNRMFALVDEASGVGDKIVETLLYGFNDDDTQRIIYLAGNPLRDTGAFAETFPNKRQSKLWQHRSIDSRDVPEAADRELLDLLVSEYGEESDEIRTRIRGLLPTGTSENLIPVARVEAAYNRQVPYDPQEQDEPLLMGVDPARFGDDRATIVFRRGRDAVSIPWQAYSSISLDALEEEVERFFHEYQVDMIFVDSGGLGAGLVDFLRKKGLPVTEVDFSTSATGDYTYMGHTYKLANLRADVWHQMADWLNVGVIPEKIGSTNMTDEFCKLRYMYNSKDCRIMEPKSTFKKREGFSPDFSDGLAVTFATKVHKIKRPANQNQPEPHPLSEQSIYRGAI